MSFASSLALAPYLRWRFANWDADRLADHQRRRLRAVIDHAAANSDWYRQRITPGTHLADVPHMDKATMMADFKQINTAWHDRDDLIAFRIRQEHDRVDGYYEGGYSVGLSSGTSGNKVLTVLSTRERDRYAALLWARSGVPPGTKPKRVLFALRVNNQAFTTVTRFGVHLVYVDYLQPSDTLVDLINDHRLNILAGPPSILTELAERRRLIQGRVDAVISYAEELDLQTRSRLEDAFGTRIAEIYQGAEGMLGTTCPAGSLHLNEDVAFVELEDVGDTVGSARSVTVTDLYRTSQPFLRYRLDDVLEIGDRACSCGSAFRRIERIHGRADDVILLLDAEGRTVRLMPDYVRRSINRASPDIEEYQATQHAPGTLEIRLLVRSGADRAAIRDAILSNLVMWSERAGAARPAVTFCDGPPERNPLSGKLIRVRRVS